MATKKIIAEEINEEVEEVMADTDYIVKLKKIQEENKKRIAQMQSDFNEPFPKEVERQLKKGGATLTYIPVSEVISRLNKVLGFDGWSYEIVKCERDSLDPDFIVAHVRMTVFPDGEKFVSASKDGFGGQKIKRTKAGDIVDLGDEFKGAVSDALKKAAQALGVGLYLARSEEAMGIEAEASIDPEIDLMWEQFLEVSRGLSPEKKASLNDFWKEHAGDRPKPTKQTAKMSDLEALVQQCINLTFSAE
jgi:recombination DNA repair RAD52 pathway protein